MREYRDIDIKEFNSFGIEARAERMVEFADARDLIGTLSRDKSILSEKWNVLGGGNNILFTEDYRGTLLHPTDKGIETVRETEAEVRIRLGAAVDWDSFVEWCVEREYWGVENLSFIPGYAGAAPVQNIGAYGTEIKSVIESVEMVSADTLKVATLAAEHCSFGYRDSVFKRELAGKVIITAVNIRLSKIPGPNLGYSILRQMVEEGGDISISAIRRAVIAIRQNKLPDPRVIGNAGSFFKNPVVPTHEADALKLRYPDIPVFAASNNGEVKLAAGWLIEKAGWKGRSLGPAAVWHDQALIIVNKGGATGRDILNLAGAIRSDVHAMFGVYLDTEVNCW